MKNIEKPEAIMINVPEAYFKNKTPGSFERYYESMGQNHNLEGCFYHYISTCPIHMVTHAYVCFHGKVQYKAIVVQYIRNAAPFEGWEERNWLVLTGPVVKPPEEILQRGFRGFRYTKHLF